jgi:hypothetical protein
MSDMIDRVARKICAAGFHEWPDDGYNGGQQQRYWRQLARAAIEAMREPPELADHPAAPGLKVRDTVTYSPPGSRYTYICEVKRIDGKLADIEHKPGDFSGWVDIADLNVRQPIQAPSKA